MNIADTLNEYIDSGLDTDVNGSKAWKLRVSAFLRAAGLTQEANEFQRLCGQAILWSELKGELIGFLEGLLLASQNTASGKDAINVSVSAPQPTHSKRVFIVHGHDNETKALVAHFLERLGLEPVILHEQPSAGRTVIEKFEIHSNVGFAVVLLTPDDVGAPVTDRANLTGRARQNVILELGYFIGKLTRERVCALYKKGVEIPSDYQGVLYVEFDTAGAWRSKLAQELVGAKFSINLEALLKS